MTTTKTPSIVSQIVDKLYSEGAMKVADMCKTIKYPYKSVYTKALELQKLGLVDRDDNGVWSLKEGVTPRTLETGELDESGAAEAPGEGVEPGGKGAPIVRSTGAPLDQKGLFIQELKNIGVQPKEVIPTIASIFFDGDIDDLNWLNTVLLKSAGGWVNHKQRRLIIDWWSHSRGLPYAEDDFFPDLDDEGKPKKAGARGEKAEVKTEKRLDLGIGWKIDRDRDGAWITLPGGPMSYQEAVEAAERRALIDSYKRGRAGEEAEGEETGEEGAPARKGAKRPESLIEYMMKKMVDNMLDSGKGKGDGDSETVRLLTERIDNMERERQEERFERLEGMIAGIASRDPWEDYDRIQAMKDRLGVGGPVVTDQSPAVQLIKDTTDKLDKNIGRLVGVMERTVLRSEDFTPEKTRSPQDRETKATELLGEAQARERSRGYRRETFGV